MKEVCNLTIHFNNYAEKIGIKNNLQWYRWKVFVDEPLEVLNTIKNVQYLLHKTFPNPVRISEDRNSKFALESSGWGSFKMYITVRFENGTEKEFEYYLDLTKRRPGR